MQPLTNEERKALRGRLRRAFALLPRLHAHCRAEVHGDACDVCGGVLFAQVAGGWRCLYCWPPLDLPRPLLREVEALVATQVKGRKEIATPHEDFDPFFD